MVRSRFPTITIYTDDLPDGVGGEARGPLVRIRAKYREDQGIHAHEYEHVRQWWTAGLAGAVLIVVIALMIHMPLVASLAPSGLLAHSLAYSFWRRYRLWSEVKAYQEQMQTIDRKGGHLSAEDAANRLMNQRYRLNLDYQDAVAMLKS